jgi:large subunit ribosomal protein L15
MELNNLRPASGAVKKGKRIGRGTGSGHGGTSTRGHKGDKARSGAKEKRHFEGGQTPMQRRLPKRGFKNINRVDFVPFNLSQLEALATKTGTTNFDVAALVSLGLAKASDKIKLLGNGTLNACVNLKIHAASATAKSAVEARGGSVEIV